MLLGPSASPFEICGYLLRCCEKINPQRIISDMDVGGSRQERVRSANSSLSSCTGMYNCLTVYFKRLTEGLFSERTGMSVVPLRSDVFALCTNLVGRTPKDGRGISQKQVLEQNLSSTDVHGRTSVERYTDVHFWTVYFKRLTCSRLVIAERTRMSVKLSSSEFAPQTRR